MKKICWIFLVGVFASSGCVPRPTPLPSGELEASPVPTPSSLEEAISYMHSYTAEERIVGMWAVLDYRSRALDVIPLITQNLYYQPTDEVRSNAARVLEQLGPIANQAVPDLIDVLQNDSSINVQIDAAAALGTIGDKKAVPILAQQLYQEDRFLSIYFAKSIALITAERFPDADSQGGYRVRGGVPLIVSAARDWWEKIGQYQNW
jgi:hypothetical protein